MRKKKNKKYKKVIFNLIVYMILLLVLVYSEVKIYKWYKDYNKNNEIAEQIKGTVVVEEKSEDKEEYTIDFNKLKEQNKETVAWIKVNNTNIEYPVLKADNNNFYLNHSFDRSKNSAGWIFADYRNKIDNTDKNIVIWKEYSKIHSMIAIFFSFQIFFLIFLITFSKKGLTMNVSGGKLRMLMLGKSNKM